MAKLPASLICCLGAFFLLCLDEASASGSTDASPLTGVNVDLDCWTDTDKCKTLWDDQAPECKNGVIEQFYMPTCCTKAIPLASCVKERCSGANATNENKPLNETESLFYELNFLLCGCRGDCGTSMQLVDGILKGGMESAMAMINRMKDNMSSPEMILLCSPDGYECLANYSSCRTFVAPPAGSAPDIQMMGIALGSLNERCPTAAPTTMAPTSAPTPAATPADSGKGSDDKTSKGNGTDDTTDKTGGGSGDKAGSGKDSDDKTSKGSGNDDTTDKTGGGSGNTSTTPTPSSPTPTPTPTPQLDANGASPFTLASGILTLFVLAITWD